ncbi:unnamed protein product [Nezara viridula]|uniref:FK506-binding protein n=1 Tax=Nezara viridula TaxID=85310 RepID=A0A9P0MEG7_NEZVI|nr:unnamed protein product [Nezara viridula]
MTSMFWGLRLEPGKRYSTTVDKSFHVSMAALDCTTVKSEKEVHSVMLEEGESNIPFILCNLQKPKVIQSPLNLNFVSGDRVTFFCRGNGTVHLTGYLITEDDDDFGVFGEEGEEVEEEEDEEEEEEEDVEEEQAMESLKSKVKQNGLPIKRKPEQSANANQKKKPKVDLPEQPESDGSDEDEDDEDDDEEEEEMEDESLDEEVESDEESEENEEVSETEIPKPQPQVQQQPQQQQKLNKKQKKQQQQQQQQTQQSPGQQGKQKQQANGPQQSPVQQKKKPGNEQKTPEATVPVKKTLEGGVIVKDLKVGNGPICKPGRMASVYYVGRLKSNNKVFDETTQGAGFKFRVGRGEVIKGWDVGLSGMKVGGKRLITCPPNMAYGQKGSPPTIPGNSTLMFEVELKAVN